MIPCSGTEPEDLARPQWQEGEENTYAIRITEETYLYLCTHCRVGWGLSFALSDDAAGVEYVLHRDHRHLLPMKMTNYPEWNLSSISTPHNHLPLMISTFTTLKSLFNASSLMESL